MKAAEVGQKAGMAREKVNTALEMAAMARKRNVEEAMREHLEGDKR